MRKFTKILTLILALAAIITAFTVVALAADPKPVTVSKNAENIPLDFSTYSPGVIASKLNNDGVNYATNSIVENYPGGNKYLVIDGPGSQAGGTSYFTEVTYDRSNLNVGKTPIVAMDFDVMTPTGRYGSATSNPQNTADYTSRPYYYDANKGKYVQFSGSSVGTPKAIPFSQMGLSTTPYTWQHVTIIYSYEGDGIVSVYVHVNGSEAPTYKNEHTDISASYEAVGADMNTIFFGVPYFKCSVWGQKATVAIDNYKQTYFPASYDIKDVPTYIYNDSYVMPEDYKYTVASVAYADGVTKYFDDMGEAVAAIADGCTLTLMEAPKDALMINNAITLVTGGFEVTVESTEGYGVTSEVDGALTIEKLPSVTVKWNACPTPENCECLGGHYFANESEVVLGEVPEYLFDIADSFEVDALVTKLIGWSYENDGTVDELKAVTIDDVNAGALYLYPVFEQRMYDFSKTVNGVTTYHTAHEFASLFGTTSEANNVLVTLLRDATVYKTVTLSDGWAEFIAKVTLDLRGNTLTKIDLSGNKYSYDEATDDYVANGTLAASNKYVVSTTKGYVDFTLTSSAGKNGTVISYGINGDVYYDADGNVVDYKASTVTTGNFLYFYNNAKYTLTVKNIDIYAGVFLYAQGNTNSAFNFTVDNCNYYKTVGSDNNGGEMFAFATMYDFTAVIKNSKFYYAKGLGGTNNFMRLYGKNNGVLNVTIDNCDIICETKQSLFAFYSKTDKINPTVTVKNSRVYNVGGQTSYTTYQDEGLIYSSYSDSYTTVKPGYVSAPIKQSRPYTVPTSTILTIDANSGKPVMNLTPVTKSISFDYEVKKCSEVPESVSDARFSMLYYTNFNMVVYIPVTDGMSNIALSGFTQSADTVKIDGVEFYVFVKESTTTGVSDTITAKLSYKVNGGAYRQTYKLSALVYADLMLNDPWEDVETKAIANMVRYIKEARLAAGLTVGAEFDELIALGNLAELGAKEDYADTTVDYSALAGYVSEVKFMLDGTNAAYLITLTSADVDVSVKFVGGETIALADSTATENAKYTTGTRVYDIANKAIEITVTVPAAEGGEPTVITGTYSVKAYINATNDTLTKAMYEFGIAADAYRSFLIEAAEND